MVRDQLARIWSVLRRAGVADDITIINHVAALLVLKMQGSGGDSPVELANLPANYLDAVRTILDKIIFEVPASKLFNRHVIFRLPGMLPGGRYPTPRHLVNFMCRLTEVTARHSLLDLACGSGGFLVAAPDSAEDQSADTTIGIEISPEWARLANANLLLNTKQGTIFCDSAVRVCARNGPLSQKVFDRVLMNPPFGELVDPEEVSRLYEGRALGTRSETVLSSLALDRLAPHGRMAVLLPDGMLHTSGNAEVALRRRLVVSYSLNAVIEFPLDSMQPYSPVQAHLVVVGNSLPTDDSHIWFLRVERDGYSPGRSRDITEDPKENLSDLPLVESVLTKHKSPVPVKDGLVTICIPSGDNILGLLLETAGSISSIELFESTKIHAPFLLVEIVSKPNTHELYSVDIGSAECRRHSSRSDFLSSVLKRSKHNEGHDGLPLLRDSTATSGVVVSSSGRLLGARLPSAAIQDPFDLRPSRILPSLEPTTVEMAPAPLLAQIRRRHASLLQRLDRLMARVNFDARDSATLELAGTNPIAALSEEQYEVWKCIKNYTSASVGEASAPAYFNIDTLLSLVDMPAAVVGSTIDLLERMGTILLVSIPKNNERVVAYRLATVRDLWNVSPPEEA